MAGADKKKLVNAFLKEMDALSKKNENGIVSEKELILVLIRKHGFDYDTYNDVKTRCMRNKLIQLAYFGQVIKGSYHFILESKGKQLIGDMA